MLGGATEVEARAAAFGGDEAECCAADTKGTKEQGAALPPQRTENRACSGEAANLPRPRNARQARDG